MGIFPRKLNCFHESPSNLAPHYSFHCSSRDHIKTVSVCYQLAHAHDTPHDPIREGVYTPHDPHFCDQSYINKSAEHATLTWMIALEGIPAEDGALQLQKQDHSSQETYTHSLRPSISVTVEVGATSLTRLVENTCNIYIFK
jgi:hypothetical protein